MNDQVTFYKLSLLDSEETLEEVLRDQGWPDLRSFKLAMKGKFDWEDFRGTWMPSSPGRDSIKLTRFEAGEQILDVQSLTLSAYFSSQDSLIVFIARDIPAFKIGSDFFISGNSIWRMIEEISRYQTLETSLKSRLN